VRPDLPFYRDELLAVLRAKIGIPANTNTSVVYTLTSAAQLDILCKEGWDVSIFVDRWYNAVTSVTIKIPTTNSVEVAMKFTLVRRIFTFGYRAHVAQYFHRTWVPFIDFVNLLLCLKQ